MDPNLGLLIINESMRMEAETQKLTPIADIFRNRLEKYARSLKNSLVSRICGSELARVSRQADDIVR